MTAVFGVSSVRGLTLPFPARSALLQLSARRKLRGPGVEELTIVRGTQCDRGSDRTERLQPRRGLRARYE